MMELFACPDIRKTEYYREIEEIFHDIRGPLTGQVNEASDLHVSPDGRHAVFAGLIAEELKGPLPSRVAMVDLSNGGLKLLTYGPNADRFPRFSPDGKTVAFLSDRKRAGDFQLYLLDPDTARTRATPRVDGWVEYLHWSPDGTRILLGVAGHGADVAGGQGAVSSDRGAAESQSWMPLVETGSETYRWRHAYIFDVGTERLEQVAVGGLNVWECNWCGASQLVVIASDSPDEGAWYNAKMHLLDLAAGGTREIYKPRLQLGYPTASDDGSRVAVIEALCSDRWVVAGSLKSIDQVSGAIADLDTLGADVSHCEWRSESCLLFVGHRGLETVVGLHDYRTGETTEIWASDELTSGHFYASISGIGNAGDFAIICRGFKTAPTIAAVHKKRMASIRSLDIGYAAYADRIASVERFSWQATDGLSMEGWLLRPHGKGPHPLVMNVHGGPVFHWRPMWLGPLGLSLLERGCALFFPNPRGSSGRGADFVAKVYGDMGGMDAHDLLSGVDALVAEGIADPARLGVTGASYGGYMTSRLVTLTDRFAAAVPVAPHVNNITEQLLSNIPYFMTMLMGGEFKTHSQDYIDRSPIFAADKVRTPILNIAGAKDKCTPPEEARQFHNAVVASGGTSVLVVYPEEGHGVRCFPTAIDYAARMLAWFDHYLLARTEVA